MMWNCAEPKLHHSRHPRGRLTESAIKENQADALVLVLSSTTALSNLPSMSKMRATKRDCSELCKQGQNGRNKFRDIVRCMKLNNDGPNRLQFRQGTSKDHVEESQCKNHYYS